MSIVALVMKVSLVICCVLQWVILGGGGGLNTKIESDMVPIHIYSVYYCTPNIVVVFVLFCFTLSVSADVKWAILHPEARASPAAAHCLQKGRAK